jgi:uncharacterized protein with GYD domain
MQRYLIQFNYTPQAAAAMLKNPSNRAEVLGPMIEAGGGKLEHYYFEVGGNTGYMVALYPDQKSLDVITAAIFAGGAVTSIKSTAIITAEEGVDIYKKAASMVYRPPQE